METGRLRHALVLQRPVTTTDSLGGHPEGAPQTVATVRACIEGLSGRERIGGEAMVSELTHRVTIRYRDDVVPRWRASWGRRSLEILRAYDPTGRRQWLEMETILSAIEVGGFDGQAFDQDAFDVVGAA